MTSHNEIIDQGGRELANIAMRAAADFFRANEIKVTDAILTKTIEELRSRMGAELDSIMDDARDAGWISAEVAAVTVTVSLQLIGTRAARAAFEAVVA